MAGDDRRFAHAQLTLRHVQISSAHTARSDFDEQLVRARLRRLDIRVFQRPITHRPGMMQQAGLHAAHPNSSRVSRSNRWTGVAGQGFTLHEVYKVTGDWRYLVSVLLMRSA